eukprot:192134_1
MSSVMFVFLIIQSNAYTDIIDTTKPNEYAHQALTCSGNGDCKITCDEENSCFDTTITCPPHFLCDITCSGPHSCEMAHISCPYGGTCTVNCNNEYSCQSATIYAQYSSQFKLNDCSTGDLSCNGMSIYFPPNDNGPRSTIRGGTHLTSTPDQSLHFYAIFGWHDIEFTNDRLFEGHSNAYMHCLTDYSETCSLAVDSWSCAQHNHTCNAPPTRAPTFSPTASPTFQPTEPTTEPTHYPTDEPTVKPTSFPSITPTPRPSLQPTQITSEPTMDPTIEPTVQTTVAMLSTQRILISHVFDDESTAASATQRMDWLWIATGLLVIVLCCILLVLSYFIYPTRSSKPEEHMHVNDGKSDDINKLILSALNENQNHKYDTPRSPQQDVESQYNAMPNKPSLDTTSSLRVHDNPLWHGKEHGTTSNAQKTEIEAPSRTRAFQTNQNKIKIYPNGNLSELHAQSYSQPTGYHYNENSHSIPPQSNPSAGFSYFNYMEPVALNHHLHEQQLSESLFNLQQQRLQHSSSRALTVIDDCKSSKPYTKLHVTAQMLRDSEVHRKKSTFSVELAASKLLSPLSTATPSSMAVSDRSVSDDDDEEERLLLVNQPTDEDTGFPATNGSSSSSNACSSSSSDSASSSSSSLSEDEVKRETVSPNSMDSSSTSDDMMHLMDSMDDEDAEEEQEEEDEIGIHARNATMIVKESIPHDALQIGRSPRISISIGRSELFESPFDEDHDKTVWTQTDNRKLNVEHPIALGLKEEDGKGDAHDIKGVRSPTLEIQGLISV